MAEIRTKITFLLPMYVCNMYGIYCVSTQGCIKLTLLTGDGENEEEEKWRKIKKKKPVESKSKKKKWNRTHF